MSNLLMLDFFELSVFERKIYDFSICLTLSNVSSNLTFNVGLDGKFYIFSRVSQQLFSTK